MKISCPSCSAKYSVADEKIQARLAKIRCRKCSSTIVIDGTVDPATVTVADAGPSEVAAAAAGGSAGRDGASAAPEPANDAPVQGASTAAAQAEPTGPTPGQYAVDIADNDQRNMTVGEIVTAYNEGVITAETYIWREGMADWETLAEVAEIATALHAAAAAARGPGAEPLAAPVADGSVAPPAEEHSSTDLFGGIDRAGGEDDITTSAPQAGYQPTAGTGARNESSVLFSLSALTASEPGAAASSSQGSGRSSDDSGLIDLQALTAAEPAPLSGGAMASGGAPAFGASPLLSAPLGTGGLGAAMAPGGYQKRSGARAWILGGVGVVAVVLIGFAVFFKQGGSASPTAAEKNLVADSSSVVAAKPAGPHAGSVKAAAPSAAAEASETEKQTEEAAVEQALGTEVEPGDKPVQPEAISPKDLDEVPKPQARATRRTTRPAASPKRAPKRSKPAARRTPVAKPKADKPKPAVKASPAPKPVKKKKKKSCDCAPSDLLCAMKCSAGKR